MTMPEPVSAPRSQTLVHILSTLTCLLVGGGVWFQLFRDEKPKPVPDPAVLAGAPEPVIPDEENGLLLLSQSLRSRKWPLSNTAQYQILRAHHPWDAKVMQSLLETAEDFKPLVEAALKLPGW